mgnify:CR=1 FL=1
MLITTTDVLTYIKSLQIPVGTHEVMEHFKIGKVEAEQLLQCTCDQFAKSKSQLKSEDEEPQEYLVQVPTESGLYCYFHRPTTWGDVSIAKDLINEQSIRLSVKSDISQKRIEQLESELKKNQEDFNEKIKSFYANILTILSIMISVFALVIINANLLKDLTFNGITELLKVFIVVDLPLVICLLIFLLLVKIIVVNPLIKKKR